MAGQKLPVSRLINVTVNLFTQAGQFSNFSTAMLIGSSTVIDPTQRFRSYTSLTSVGLDFGNTAPEYLAAQVFFSAQPQPAQLYIGRWVQSATHGMLVGGYLSGAQVSIATFNSITAGSLKISVNGAAAQEVDNLNFSAAANLNAVATTLSTAMSNAGIAASCSWTGNNFIISTFLTGSTASVSLTSSPSSGVDITPTFGFATSAGAYVAAGVNAESALTAAQTIDGMQAFYWLSFASASLTDADRIAIAQWVEGSSIPHMFGITTTDVNAYSAVATSDVGYQLQQLALTRTFGQWSSLTPYAVMGIIGRGCGINWLGSNTVINFMYQPEPGVKAESLGPTQADVLDTKRYNYVANYSNGTAILENGTCFGTNYIDERVGADWLANYIQTNLFNFLVDQGTKVAQTDAGIHSLLNNITVSLQQAVTNGLVAPGVWDAAGFGQLTEGDTLPLGYYIYVPPLSTQNATDRANRVSPPFQVAAKLAGAVNRASVVLNFSR